VLTDEEGNPCGGTLFKDDKQWLLRKFDDRVAFKTLRRPHPGQTTLNGKCTTANCTCLNAAIKLALLLVEENGPDCNKEADFQRLQKEGKKSLLEGDASAYFEPRSRTPSAAGSHHVPEADGSATAAPPAPAAPHEADGSATAVYICSSSSSSSSSSSA